MRPSVLSVLSVLLLSLLLSGCSGCALVGDEGEMTMEVADE